MTTFVRRIIVLILVCIQSTRFTEAHGHQNGATRKDTKSPMRLPTAFAPEHYKLEISTFLDDDGEPHPFTFTGRVWIKIICNESTNAIVLHSRGLAITPSLVTLNQLDLYNRKRYVALKGIEADEANDFLTIVASQNLTVGSRYELHIPFEGELTEDPFGYYRSSYFDIKSNKTLWMTVTQFEALDARNAFPCFDEPAMKAKFEVILCHRPEFSALSNMPIVKSIVDKTVDNWVCDYFKKSVTMSTYLVAFSINKFEHRDSDPRSNGGLRFRVWSRPDFINDVDYALWLTPRVLRYFETYLSLPYPLPKLDLIAVPYLAAAGMENYGLITFAEDYLLYSINDSTLLAQQRVATVIAHELGHMWFGNLVTLNWWSEVWLNEGFPTYMTNLCLQHVHPEWNFMQIEDFHNILVSLRIDAKTASTPLLGDSEVATDEDISLMFQGSAYEKGATMVRMLHHVLGDVAFRNGLRRFLRTFQYGNVVIDDFVQSMQLESGVSASEMPLSKIMDTWMRQPGYPVIYVQRNYDDKSVLITQQRYVDPKDVEEGGVESANVSPCWWIPLKTLSQSNAAKDHQSSKPKGIRPSRNWLQCDSSGGNGSAVATRNIFMDDVNGTEWLLHNAEMTGLFRVRYDTSNWEMLIDQLDSPHFKHISPVNRAQLIDDAMGEAWTGGLKYDLALKLMSYLSREDDYIPWAMAVDNFDTLDAELQGTSLHHLFRGFVRNLLTQVYEKVGGLNWNADSHLININLKTIIIKYGCQYNVSDCHERATSYFKELMEAPNATNRIPADLRSTVYCTVIRSSASKDEWDFLHSRYFSLKSLHEQDDINEALDCVGEQTRSIVDNSFVNALVNYRPRHRFQTQRSHLLRGRSNSRNGPTIQAELDFEEQSITEISSNERTKMVQPKKYGLKIRNKLMYSGKHHRRTKRALTNANRRHGEATEWFNRSRADMERFLKRFQSEMRK